MSKRKTEPTEKPRTVKLPMGGEYGTATVEVVEAHAVKVVLNGNKPKFNFHARREKGASGDSLVGFFSVHAYRASKNGHVNVLTGDKYCHHSREGESSTPEGAVKAMAAEYERRVARAERQLRNKRNELKAARRMAKKMLELIEEGKRQPVLVPTEIKVPVARELEDASCW